MNHSSHDSEPETFFDLLSDSHSPRQSTLETDHWLSNCQETLQKYWGYREFRPFQQQAIESVLKREDSLVVLPTGGGKSLCYQVPAVVREGMAVVVSPLIALMKDQVDTLTDLGIPAAAVNSSQSPEEQRQIAARIRAGELKILYVAPERLCTERMLSFLEDQKLSFIAVDEAHCISSWGHQFRPEYRLLGKLRERFPGIDLHAYTATATQQVREDMVQQLQLKKPRVLVGNFDRPNLTYRVVPRQDFRKQVLAALDQHAGEAGIIYCISRKQVEELNESLLRAGYRSAAYHAGMEHQARQQAQEDFLNEQVNIIVATVAFGMGIDKPNVRFVIHASATKSIENYQQETGRAGRDGLASACYLFYSGQDFATWKKLQSELQGEAAEVANRQLQLKSQFCTTLLCRHRQLVEHFGQSYPAENCGACDVCLNEVDELDDALVVAQKILSCVVRVEQRFGGEYVANVLAGSQDQRVLSNGHDQLSTYGLLRTHSKKNIRNWIDQLLAQNCLEREEQYGTLTITATGRQVFRAEFQPRLLAAPIRQEKAKSASKPHVSDLDEQEMQLFEELRTLRREIAAEKRVAPFVIFGDVTLVDLSRRRPVHVDTFLQVHGVGRHKCEEYAERFLNVILRVSNRLGLAREVGFTNPADTTSQSTLELTMRNNSSQSHDHDAENLSLIKQQAAALFAERLSLEEVSEKLQRALSTTTQYLAEYLEREKLTSAQPWVDEETFQKISLAAMESDSDRLKPIYESLNGEATYDEIRLVLTCLKNMEPG